MPAMCHCIPVHPSVSQPHCPGRAGCHCTNPVGGLLQLCSEALSWEAAVGLCASGGCAHAQCIHIRVFDLVPPWGRFEPCTNVTAEVYLRVYLSPCINDCGIYGQCKLLRTNNYLYAACECKAGKIFCRHSVSPPVPAIQWVLDGASSLLQDGMAGAALTMPRHSPMVSSFSPLCCSASAMSCLCLPWPSLCAVTTSWKLLSTSSRCSSPL